MYHDYVVDLKEFKELLKEPPSCFSTLFMLAYEASLDTSTAYYHSMLVLISSHTSTTL